MTPLDDILLADTEQLRQEGSPGRAARLEADQLVEQEQGAARDAAGFEAYSQSPLNRAGALPEPEKYNYGGAVSEGTSLEPDEAGNVALPNAHIRPNQVTFGGYDVGDGHKVFSSGLSPDGNAWVQAGVLHFQATKTNTNGEASVGGDRAHARAALGHMAEGRSFEDYASSTQSAGGDERQSSRAWRAAAKVGERQEIEDFMQLSTNTAAAQIRLAVANNPKLAARLAAADAAQPPPSFSTETVVQEEAWGDAGAKLYELMHGTPFVGSRDEISAWALDTVIGFNHNVALSASMVAYLGDATVEEAQAFQTLMAYYDATDTDGKIIKGAIGANIVDPLNWTVAGLEAKVLALVGRSAIREMYKAPLANALLGAAEGGIVMGGENVRGQTAEVATGEREAIDPGEVAGDVAIGAAVGTVLGGGVGFAAEALPLVMKGAKAAREKMPEVMDLAGDFAADTSGRLSGREAAIATVDPGDFTNQVDRLAQSSPELASREIGLAEKSYLALGDEERAAVKRNGAAPWLTIRSDVPVDPTLSITAATNATKNLTLGEKALDQQGRLDVIDAKHARPLDSPEAWAAFQADIHGNQYGIVPPSNLMKDLQDVPSWAARHAQLSPSQLAHVNDGIEMVTKIGDKYADGTATSVHTGKLFMWSFLSRGVNPFTQEGMFLKASQGAEPFIEAAARGEFDAKMLKKYLKWSKTAAPAGTGEAGAGAAHNLNAFGEKFLFKMSQKNAAGEVPMQLLHDMIADQDMPSRDIRRKFFELATGVGIDNKVVSFSLLAAGRSDVMILDRVQLRNLWDDGRFGDVNLYDNSKQGKKQMGGTGLADFTYGYRGLAMYEKIEDALAEKLPEMYAAIGREGDASMGRYHWESWVLKSEQEVSHPTLGTILRELEGEAAPAAGVRVRQGAFDTYGYGVEYGVSPEGAGHYIYQTSDGTSYQFTPSEWGEFQKVMKAPKTGIIPKGFKVSEQTKAPWVEHPDVDRELLDRLIAERGTPLQE